MHRKNRCFLRPFWRRKIHNAEHPVSDIAPGHRRNQRKDCTRQAYHTRRFFVSAANIATGDTKWLSCRYAGLFHVRFCAFRLYTAAGTAANRGTAKPIGWDRFLLLRGIPAGISLILLSIPYGTTTNFVALYAEQIHLHVPSGFFFVILAAGMGISRLFAGRYVDRGRVTECIHCGFYLVVSAFLLLSTCALLVRYRPEAARMIFFVVPALQGIGFGIMFPAYNSLYINLAPHNRRATATSTYLTSWDFGIGTGILLGGMLARTHGFAAVYLCGGLLSLLSMLYFHKIVTPHYHRYKYPEGGS